MCFGNDNALAEIHAKGRQAYVQSSYNIGIHADQANREYDALVERFGPDPHASVPPAPVVDALAVVTPADLENVRKVLSKILNMAHDSLEMIPPFFPGVSDVHTTVHLLAAMLLPPSDPLTEKGHRDASHSTEYDDKLKTVLEDVERFVKEPLDEDQLKAEIQDEQDRQLERNKVAAQQPLGAGTGMDAYHTLRLMGLQGPLAQAGSVRKVN